MQVDYTLVVYIYIRVFEKCLLLPFNRCKYLNNNTVGVIIVTINLLANKFR